MREGKDFKNQLELRGVTNEKVLRIVVEGRKPTKSGKIEIKT